ncbi:MAG: ATP-binding protein [Bacteroidales bacterium]|nr:ATP-binding protein [Bacteroidales bacterium]
MIKRLLQEKINTRFNDNKAIIITGPRQAGKTTLMKEISKDLEKPFIYWNGDEADIKIMLENATSSALRNLIGNNKIIFFDEAQRIQNIALCIKLIVDNIKDVKVIATGSSSFQLTNIINEPLTGRKWEFMLYPLSFEEMAANSGINEELRLLEQRMVYGYYPDVVNNPAQSKDILKELSGSYLYKDLLLWENILKPDKLEKLIQAIAFQIGNEVSFNELSNITGLNNETVERYIDLLEKTYVIFRLGSFSRNLRSELKKSRKIYFVDNGIRNAVINNFNPLALRDDTGKLWENWLVSERIKYIKYHSLYSNQYFWRTYNQQEIDYIEERDGTMFAYEFKWSKKTKYKFPNFYSKTYPDSKNKIINRENFIDFITMQNKEHTI